MGPLGAYYTDAGVSALEILVPSEMEPGCWGLISSPRTLIYKWVLELTAKPKLVVGVTENCGKERQAGLCLFGCLKGGS